MSYAFSIIITFYNHKNYLGQLKQMLEKQEFKDFEVIIIDNNSTDGSKELLQNFNLGNIPTKIVFNPENLGICKAFNLGVKMSCGEYLIDLAPDDEFLAHKLSVNYKVLKTQRADLLFSDCELIHTNGSTLGLHSKLYPFNYTGPGNYFCDLLERHRIASPTMVVSKELYEKLNGYDENLAYEDFDFISRATLLSDLVYDTDVLVKKHLALKSLSTQFDKRKNGVHTSTFEVCTKLKDLCKTIEHKQALKSRIRHELKTQIKLVNLGLIYNYLKLSFSLRT